MEILERVMGISLVGWHVAACRDGVLPDDQASAVGKTTWAKQILYAQRDLVVSETANEVITHLNHEIDWPLVADIPRVGSVISDGSPIVTVFASNEEICELRRQLTDRAVQVSQLFHP
jgi:predicted ATP-grasp superfamily ATP-dependent carboligase